MLEILGPGWSTVLAQWQLDPDHVFEPTDTTQIVLRMCRNLMAMDDPSNAGNAGPQKISSPDRLMIKELMLELE